MCAGGEDTGCAGLGVFVHSVLLLLHPCSRHSMHVMTLIRLIWVGQSVSCAASHIACGGLWLTGVVCALSRVEFFGVVAAAAAAALSVLMCQGVRLAWFRYGGPLWSADKALVHCLDPGRCNMRPL